MIDFAEIRKYDLPDSLMCEDGAGNGLMIWQPATTCIVLGASNKPELSVDLNAAAHEHIDIYKRSSGGEAVVLSPNMLVISLVLRNIAVGDSKAWFRKINGEIIAALAGLGVDNLCYKGISDIAIGEKKILGSSICRKKSVLLYHAVLNISEPVSTFSKYLLHPKREPDYRMGRSHADFVSSLKNEGWDLSHITLKEVMQKKLGKLILQSA